MLEEGVSGILELGMILLAVHNSRSRRLEPVRHPPELLPRAGGYVTEIVWYDHISRWVYHGITSETASLEFRLTTACELLLH